LWVLFTATTEVSFTVFFLDLCWGGGGYDDSEIGVVVAAATDVSWR
jgi:hypothetical protein